MKRETLDKLAFDHIRQRLAAFCSCALGKRLAQAIEPSTHDEMVRRWQTQAREFAKVSERSGPPPMGGVHDIRAEIQASGRPAPLEGEALARVSETLEATDGVCAWLRKAVVEAPSLEPLCERLVDYSALGQTIRESIDTRGRVYDTASPRLRSIRRTIDEAHDRINAVFDRLLSSSSNIRMLQYTGTTFHNDRVVLPLRAEHRGRIPGIIHRSSDSGATLFVEPAEVVELNNTIVRLRESEQKEITRILTELTRLVHAEAEGILGTLRVVGVLDLNRAKWAFAKHYHCSFPRIDPGRSLELHEARHPVLIDLFSEAEADGTARQVVPIDVRLGSDFDALVITGPNTGGKTVALKTVGLLALMAQSGLAIPAAEGSCVPVYERVFVDIGDEQSLQQSLSTFSSHLSNQLGILRRSDARTLVLIDELGAGTDPDEGAAIGRTLIEELLSAGASAMVTTHLSALKALAYSMDRVDNASVEFDPATLEPTFRLLIGEPGNSNALIIAQRLGMPARVVARARQHLSGRRRALDKAIRGTLHSRREAEDARKVARRATLEVEQLRKALEAEQRALDQERRAYEKWSDWVGTLGADDEVYVTSFEQTGRVVRVQLHKQSALVNIGVFEVEVPLSQVRPPDHQSD